eukprot:4326531-Amphidinium_carterae.2
MHRKRTLSDTRNRNVPKDVETIPTKPQTQLALQVFNWVCYGLYDRTAEASVQNRPFTPAPLQILGNYTSAGAMH